MKIRNFVSESRLENWRENTNCWDRREKKVKTKDRFMTVGIAATELHKSNTLTQDAPQSPPPRVWKAGMHLNVILSSTAEILSKRSPRFSGHNLPRTRRNAYLAIQLWILFFFNLINGEKWEEEDSVRWKIYLEKRKKKYLSGEHY